MANGTEQPISAVQVGDEVLATDPETGQTAARPVAALIRHSGQHTMVNLTFDDASMISATDHHAFWDATTSTFTDAINLPVGDRVLSDTGRTLAIVSATTYRQVLTAYNLQVDGIHTYYAGATPILVHNSCVDDAVGIQHSLDAHLAGGVDNTAEKSIWSAGTDAGTLSRLADATEGTIGIFSRKQGTVQYVVNAGRIVGTSGGRSTTFYTVTRDPFDAGVVTMFPGM